MSKSNHQQNLPSHVPFPIALPTHVVLPSHVTLPSHLSVAERAEKIVGTVDSTVGEVKKLVNNIGGVVNGFEKF
jgi:hypothetical protein